MNRVSYQSIKSMSYIFFNSISRFNINKEGIFRVDPSLIVQGKFDEIVVKEVDDFLNMISLMFIDVEEGLPNSKEELLTIKRIMHQELSCIEDIEGEDYQTKLIEFIKTTMPDYMLPFFEEIIKEAKRLREKQMKMFEPGISLKIIKDVLHIYEKADGSPSKTESMTCPICEFETTNYFCNWFDNRHVHFCCENCGMSVMQ